MINCSVCGKPVTEEDSMAATSPILPITNRYCKTCAANRLEPYTQLVDLLSVNELHWPKDVNPTYRSFISNQLSKHGVTEEQFVADVYKAMKE